LNVYRAGEVRQTEMHTAEPFVPDPCAWGWGCYWEAEKV
jgi:hypothetical protein